MDINIRQAIKQNLEKNDTEGLRATVLDAIQDGQEKMLPGLGVLFEIIWQQSSSEQQDMMIQNLSKGV